MSCPDLLLLSQLVDGELPPPDATPLRIHVESCTACRARLARLDHAIAEAHAALSLAAPPPPEAAPGCLPAEHIAAWAGRTLSGDELAATDDHLQGCDACLPEALGALRTMAMLDAGPPAAVPDALRGRVASRWKVDPAPESLTAIVVRLARTGVTLLERHVVAPVLGVEELLVPAPALRAGEPGDRVSFRIRAPEAQIQATIVPEGAAVGLSLNLSGADDRALAGQRVFLRRHGRSIYSARTDDAGALLLPRIEPGVYEVSCPGIATSFRLDLRR